MKILIYGLPGSGKTYLAEILAELLGDQAVHLNIDSIRKETGFLKLYDSQGELLVPNTIQQLAEESVLEGVLSSTSLNKSSSLVSVITQPL